MTHPRSNAGHLAQAWFLESVWLDDDTAVYPVAYIGAPTIFIEKLICGDDLDLAVAKLEELTGKPAGATMSAEIGGVNSIVPLALCWT